jgi:hypothetical protein
MQIRLSWLFAITVSVCVGPLGSPLHAQTEKGPQALAGESDVDYARCMSDWDRETHMTKREWQRSCSDVVKEDPGAFETVPGERPQM